MDSESSLRLVEAEANGGRPLVQVGFMRRFDPEYAQMKALLESGAYGRTLLVHNTHRNQAVPDTFRSEMIVRDSLVHEVDVARFVFGEEITEITVLAGVPTGIAANGVLDPQVALFRMAGGGMVTSEVFVNCQVGYEVRCEVVAERGTITAGMNTTGIYTTLAGEGPGATGAWGGPIAPDFRVRFARAYDLEVQSWVDASAARGGGGSHELGRVCRDSRVHRWHGVAGVRSARRGRPGRPPRPAGRRAGR